MKFLTYTLGDSTAPTPEPPAEMYEKMGAFIEEISKAGALLMTGGVSQIGEAVRVSYDGADFTVLDGPFAEAKELVGGWALLECRDTAEAVEWTKRFLTVAGPGHGEVTVRPVSTV
jgi:hypothetical protein